MNRRLFELLTSHGGDVHQTRFFSREVDELHRDVTLGANTRATDGIAECRTAIAECRVQSAECRTAIAECRVQNGDCRVQSAERRLQNRIVLCTLQSVIAVHGCAEGNTGLRGGRARMRAPDTGPSKRIHA